MIHIDKFQFAVVVGFLIATSIYTLLFALIELVRVYKRRTYRPRAYRSTYTPATESRPKHRA